MLERGRALWHETCFEYRGEQRQSCSGQWIQARGTIDAAFAHYRRDAKRPILRVAGNAWPLLPNAANRCRLRLQPPVHEREQHRSLSSKENHMSSISNLTSASSALPPLSIHTHNHKKGSNVGSTDDSGSSSAAHAASGS